MFRVRLIKGEGRKDGVWFHDSDSLAYRRATALAELHGVREILTQDGEYVVDATHYYQPRAK